MGRIIGRNRHKTRRTRAGLWAGAAVILAALNYLLVGGVAGAGPSSAAASTFVPVGPTTVVSAHALTANQVDTVTIAGAAGTNVPAEATAVQFALTLTGASAGPGWLDSYPAGGTPIAAARWLAGQELATEVTTRLSAAGKVSFRARTHNVTFTARVTGYYISAALAPGSVSAGDLSAAGATTGQVLTANAGGVDWQSPSTTYTATPAAADWKWNSVYVFNTSANSYTEYFTRYVTLAVPALTQAVLDAGSVQVFMTPAFVTVPSQWEPLPYSFDSSFGYTDNFTYVTAPGQLVLHFFFVQNSSTATLPLLATYPIAGYHFKIVVTPGTGTATPVTPSVARQARSVGTARREVCTDFPGGRHCHTA